MPLPSDHQWYNKKPTVSNDFFFGAWIGASNLPVGNQSTTGEDHYNTLRNLIYKHNDTIVGFSDAPNNQSVTTYPNLDETGTQNIVSFFSEEVRKYTDRKILCVTGGESTKGLSNSTNGFHSTLMFDQTVSLLEAAQVKAGKALDFICLAVSDGDMKFNRTEQNIIDNITDYIADLRSSLSLPNLRVFIRCPGVIPTTPATAAIYPTWDLHNTTLKALNIANVYPVDTDSLTVALYREADEVHGNAAGNKECSKLIIDEIILSGLLPRY